MIIKEVSDMAYSCDKVFEFFREICAIPHGTYHIEEISDYLADFARSRGPIVQFRMN